MSLKPLLLLGFTVAFVGGLAGNESAPILCVALAAFITACGVGGRWWIWFVLALSAWAGGSLVLMLLRLGSSVDLPAMPGRADTMLTVAIAGASALVGTCVNWAAARLIRQP